jgi:hypothetical protein
MEATNMTPEWIADVVRRYPFMGPMKNDAGEPNGNYRTCPCRISFPNIFAKSKPIPPNIEGSYNCNLIIPEMADISLIREAGRQVALEKWSLAGQPGGPKLAFQIKAQADLSQYEGYGQAGWLLTASANKQVPVVDQNMAPVIESQGKIYPGAWVIAVIRPFAYDKGVKKGVSFGLQSLMWIADDRSLASGGSNPVRDFAGVNITSDVNPAAAFGNGAAPTQPGKVDIFS